MIFPLVCLLCLLSPLQATPIKKPVADEPPLIGQPMNFSGAVGIFKIAAQAEPTELYAEDSLVLNVRITSKGTPKKPPPRPDLRSLPKFKNRFVIQDLPAMDRTKLLAGGQEWEFRYRLKPRNSEVREIPPLLFVYYKPGVVPPAKGYWTTASESIPLTVKPRSRATLVDAQGNPLRPPGRLYHLVEGPAVLEREEILVLPGPLTLVLLLLAPPFACAIWYLAWRRMYPDAERLAWLRRSRAARLALKALRRRQGGDIATQAELAVAVMETYLAQRFDLSGASPTPLEVSEHLERTGISNELADKTAEFFRICDAVRYACNFATHSGELAPSAERLIHALEDEAAANAEKKKSVEASDEYFETPRRQPAACFLVCWLATSFAATPPSSEALLAEAEAAFREGGHAAGTPEEAKHFQKSADLYERLHQRGFRNSALYRNQGNAHLLSGDLPRAVLAYRRGLRLNPDDREMQANLAYARSQVVYPAVDGFARPAVDHWPPWLPHLSFPLRWGLALIFYGLACVGFTRWRMTARRRFMSATVIASAAALLLGASLMIGTKQIQDEAEHPLIVITKDEVFLRKGNGRLYSPRYDIPLNRGVEARLLHRNIKWLQIELSGGEIGWVHLDDDALLDAPD